MIIFQKEPRKTIDKHRIVCYISYSKSITTIQIKKRGGFNYVER